ncbi:MAG TPA: hypothetical protein IGS52_18530 [Oscillatoriaceae cyanobacterium M33_DOE_052]|uniref:Uncharacterized protein n=1 Tax=Planktothricoides sp. SpSt-374 TaxID=2282167 RepID=A0A7C3VUW6_9CYAN|nr:hypothetical protein [Oscillatoriaceae cyanobacterium M33_DOE_052]
MNFGFWGEFWGFGVNFGVKLYIVGARHPKYLGFTNNLNDAVPPTTENLDIKTKVMAKKPGFCDNFRIKTEIWLRNPVSVTPPRRKFWVGVGTA